MESSSENLSYIDHATPEGDLVMTLFYNQRSSFFEYRAKDRENVAKYLRHTENALRDCEKIFGKNAPEICVNELNAVRSEIAQCKANIEIEKLRQGWDNIATANEILVQAGVYFAYWKLERERDISDESQPKIKRTKRTPGEPTKPKQVHFPQSMAADLKAVAAGRSESVNKFIVDACAERLQSHGGPAPIMITVPSDIPKNLRAKIEEMADSLTSVVAEMCDQVRSSDPDDPNP